MASASPDLLPPGFKDPVLESQDVFRSILAAMAQPGLAQGLTPHLDPPAPLTPVAAAVRLSAAR